MPTDVTYHFTDGPGNTASGAQVSQNFTDAMTAIDRVAAVAGVPVPVTSAKMRGASIIPTTGTRTNTAFGALSDGPDQVSGIVLPANGLIAVQFQATWQNSVASAGVADIFLGANELKVATTGQSVPVPIGTVGPSVINTDSPVASFEHGLISTNSGSYGGDATTGQAVGIGGAVLIGGSSRGGPCYIFAAPGTYTVSVQFKSSSGSVTVKNRRLWVWVEGF